MASPLRILYVMDPPARILVDKDTTFAFMCEGDRRGHEQYYCGVEDLFVDRSTPQAAVRSIRAQPGQLPTLGRRGGPTRSPGSTPSSCARTRPSTWPSSSPRTSSASSTRVRTFVINDPRGLRDANEKLYALHFPDVIPDEPRQRRRRAPEGVHGGARRRDDRQAARRLRRRRRLPRPPRATATSTRSSRSSTQNGTRLVMAQRYLPEMRDRATSASSCSTASRSAPSCACRARTSTAATSTSAARVERGVVDARDREICRRAGAAAARRRPLLRRPRRHRRLAHRGERHQPHRHPGDQPPRRRVPRGQGHRLRRAPGRHPRPPGALSRHCDESAVAAR